MKQTFLRFKDTESMGHKPLMHCMKKSRLLAEYKFTEGVEDLSRTTLALKMSGNVNETTLYRSVLGPLGLGSNIMNGVSLRMMLGFTRNGGPIMRGRWVCSYSSCQLQDSKHVHHKVANHHEVVAIFNELDSRF